MHGVIVGHSDLERTHADTSVRAGAFRPGLGYELVEPIFQLGDSVDAADRARYAAAVAKLALELVDASGRIVPTSRIEIRPRRTPELEVAFATSPP
jgi:hypothetical protein